MTRPADRVCLVRDPASGVEALHAWFGGYAYDPHRHDDWLVGVTLRGAQDFSCRGRRHRSTPGRIILIEPQQLHDGQAGTADGFAYSMLYLPQPWLRQGLACPAGHEPGFRACLDDDPQLAASIRTACALLAVPSARLERDEALDRVLSRLRPLLGHAVRTAPAGPHAGVARRARDRLLDCLVEDIGADALARSAGAADRFHLARAFRAAYGTSPHLYLVQMRLLRARRMLARGEAPAAVAASCGFADQSHLGRWFRRAYGMTPGVYRRGRTGVPDAAGRDGWNAGFPQEEEAA